MIYLQLFYEFFKVGLFTVGGGLAAVPFLLDMGESTGWFTGTFVTEMIGISESTPGPIGINMASYVGYDLGGIPGSIIASLGMAAPSMIIAFIVTKCLMKFAEYKGVKASFYGLRPVVVALICCAAWRIINTAIIHTELIGTAGVSFNDIVELPKLIYFGIIFFLIYKFKKHPIIYIAISAVVGIILKF